MLGNTSIVKPLPLVIFEGIAFIAWLAAFGAYGFLFHASIHATEHSIPPLQIQARFVTKPQKTPPAEASGGNKYEPISH